MRIPPLPLAVGLLAAVCSCAIAQTPAPELLFAEDFENVPLGEIPKGFTKTGAVGVADDAAHSGHKALKMEAAIKGPRKITLKGEPLASLGGEHWGRLYYKVKLPAPSPVIPEGQKSGVIHSAMVDGTATSPLFNDKINLGLFNMLLTSDGVFSYLYNVLPGKGRREFGARMKPRFYYTDEWILAEWHVDYATQSYQFFINGEELPELALHKGAGQFAGAEIPEAFDNLSFGFTNYQPASDDGFVTWIDDLAVGKKRLGGGPLPNKPVGPMK
jgi:hypothetical protein